jgi:hypothetical protein
MGEDSEHIVIRKLIVVLSIYVAQLYHCYEELIV